MICDPEEFKSRLAKISGQIEALQRMYEEKRSAQEILQQLIAVRSSLSSLGKLIVEAEVKNCLPSGEKDKPVSQLVDTLFKIT